MLSLLLCLSANEPNSFSYRGEDVAFAARKSNTGEWIEELQAKDEKGKFRTILVTPTYGAIQIKQATPTVTALERPGKRLFQSPPSLNFDTFEQQPWREGSSVKGQV